MNKKLVVVHGMGQHTADSVTQEVKEACEKSFSLYDDLNGQAVNSKFDIVAIAYNQFFDNYRQQISQRSGSLADELSAIGELSLIGDVTQEITDMEASLGKDSMFTTHWLDVILYRFTFLAEHIRLHVAQEINNVVMDSGAQNVHVMGHSLGSALVHDTLQKMYGPDRIGDPDNPPKLSPTTSKLGGVHMVSNVSRVLQSFAKTGSSIVRPGKNGCTHQFIEYRHKLDPFTYFKPFDPTNNGGWISNMEWLKRYSLIEPTEVIRANTHSLGHYIENPCVHNKLFRLLFSFRPNRTEREKAFEKYMKNTAEGKAKALREAIERLDFKDDSIKSVITAGKSLKDLVESFGESFA